MNFFNKNGSILIFTLWIILIIAVLALGIAYTARLEVKTVSYNLDDLKNHYAIRGGVSKILNKLKEYYDIKGYDTTKEYKKLEGDEFSFEGIKGSYKIIKIQDEGAKININLAQEEVIKQVPSITEKIGNYIINNRPFKNLESLIISENISDQLMSGLGEDCTVYGDKKINFNTCESYLLNSLTGMPSLQQGSMKGKIKQELKSLTYFCDGGSSVNVLDIRKAIFKGLREIKNNYSFFETVDDIKNNLRNNSEVVSERAQFKNQIKNTLRKCCMIKSSKVDGKSSYCQNWADDNSNDITNEFFDDYIFNNIFKYIDIKSTSYRMTIEAEYQDVEKKVTVVGNKFDNTIRFWYTHYYNKYK